MADAYDHLIAVQQAHVAELMAMPHVVGVGIGLAQRAGQLTDQVAIVVLVDEKLPRAQLAGDAIIPAELDGVRVDVQQVGTPTAQ
jgi:hypothetical protein